MTFHRPILRCASWILCAAFLSVSVRSQPAKNGPGIAFVYPAGGCRGTTFTVKLGGQRLEGASAAFFSFPGAKAEIVEYQRFLSQKEFDELEEKIRVLQEKRTDSKSPGPNWTDNDKRELAALRAKRENRPNRQVPNTLAETVTLEITLPPDAPTGPAELRLKTPSGLTNPLVFQVDELAGFNEPIATRERNDTPRNDTVNTMNVTLPVILNGRIMPAEEDRFRFTARRGQKLVFAAQARALIPFLADAVPGWFQATLTLYDAKGVEIAYVDDFRFDPDPVLFCEIPHDGDYVIEIKDALHRGREDFIYRIAAGELPYVTGIFPLGGPASSATVVRVNGRNLIVPAATIAGGEPGVSAESLVTGAPGWNRPIFVRSSGTELTEIEPNDDSAEAQAVAGPVTINGRIASAEDCDVFRIKGHQGDELVAEVTARRLRSPLDSVVTVSDSSGTVLASNDDYEDRSEGLLTHQADSLLQLTLPKDGDYFVAVRDTSGGGGEDYAYRLRIGPPLPDFTVLVMPSTLNLRAGDKTTLNARVVRRDGFTGPIRLSLAGSADGVKLKDAEIPANRDEANFTLSVSSSLGAGVQSLSFVAQAKIGEREVKHAVIPADERMQAFLPRHLVPARATLLHVSAGLRWKRPPQALVDGPLRLSGGQTTKLKIRFPEQPNLDRIRLELADPPEGVKLAGIAAGTDEIEIALDCDASRVKTGRRGSLVFNAFSEQTSSATADQPAKIVRQPCTALPAVPFEIVAAPAR